VGVGERVCVGVYGQFLGMCAAEEDWAFLVAGAGGGVDQLPDSARVLNNGQGAQIYGGV
jgi:hypothetical protein